MNRAFNETCKDCPNKELIDTCAPDIDEGSVTCQGLIRGAGRGGTPLFYCHINIQGASDFAIPSLAGMLSRDVEGATRVMFLRDMSRFQED